VLGFLFDEPLRHVRIITQGPATGRFGPSLVGAIAILVGATDYRVSVRFKSSLHRQALNTFTDLSVRLKPDTTTAFGFAR
jgi:hypothetical protein